MHEEITLLEPQGIWRNFVYLNAIPRASKKEEKVIKFIVDFGNNLGLKTYQDEVGNVIIKKPATAGMEDFKTVLLQSHLDMVHQKNAETVFDFDRQGIEMFIDEDWVKAKGTTLGADNGIGVATIMAILESKTIEHPALEALFTIDEETGMTGALGLKGGLLESEIMLNLDSEYDKELTIGCAGGIDITATGRYDEESTSDNNIGIKLQIKGLTGGHSGMDIHKGRANANKLMNRLLYHLHLKYGIRIHSLNGGSLRNAIPRESECLFSVSSNNYQNLIEFLEQESQTIKAENTYTDSETVIQYAQSENNQTCWSLNFQDKVLRSIYACPSGIYRMSPTIPGLVQSSNNLARVVIMNGQFTIQCLTRSSVDSEKMDLAHAIKCSFELCDAEVNFSGSYPGWEPNPNSNIIEIMKNIYQEMNHEEPLVSACHAGLECGILGRNYPKMEMISFGPNILGAHSPDERVQISSVNKYWNYLLETLKRIPKK